MEILWHILQPGNVLLLLLSLGVVLLFTKRQGLGKKLVALVALILLIIAILPVGSWLLLPLEKRFAPPKTLPDNINGIIVLGGAFKNDLILAHRQLVLKDSGERIVAFFQLARRYPKARLVFAGGSGSLGPKGLGDALPAESFFELMGIDFDRVILEERARNTYENAVFSRQIISRTDAGQWILITSAWHMPRAVGVFRKAGWTSIPYPVDFRTDGRYGIHLDYHLAKRLELLELGTKEWMALIHYRIMGWCEEWFPGPSGNAPQASTPN
ncbi:MAG: YdcF family protein [Pseudomonadota bacterium]